MKSAKLMASLISAQVQIRADDSMTLAARKVLLAEFLHMLDCENACLRGDDMGAVHHMRVSCRRLRSALQLLRPYYDVEQVKPLRAGVRQLGKRLGAVRDYDVFLLALAPYCDQLEANSLSWDELRQQLRHTRARHARRLSAYLASGKYRRSLRAIRAFLRASPPKQKGGKRAPREVRHVLPLVLHQQLAIVRAYDDKLPVSKVSTLHQLRIEIKRLRYLITQFAAVLGTSADSFVSELKRMQDELGALNDIYSARAILARLPREGDAKDSLIPAYLALLRERETACVAQFAQIWRGFQTRRLHRQFSDALLVLR